MEEFLEIFGQWTAGRAVSYIVADILLDGVYWKIADYVNYRLSKAKRLPVSSLTASMKASLTQAPQA